MPLSVRKEVYDAHDVWQSEGYTSAEIARIYDPFPISGWIFSNPVFAKNQKLEYLPDQEAYEKPGHLYAVQLQKEALVVLDRFSFISLLYFLTKYFSNHWKSRSLRRKGALPSLARDKCWNESAFKRAVHPIYEGRGLTVPEVTIHEQPTSQFGNSCGIVALITSLVAHSLDWSSAMRIKWSKSNTDWCRRYLIAAHQQILKGEHPAPLIIHS